MYGRQLGFKRKTILANKDSRSKVFNAVTRIIYDLDFSLKESMIR